MTYQLIEAELARVQLSDTPFATEQSFLREQHELKPLQERGMSDEEADAMPVESEANGAEINGSHVSIQKKARDFSEPY